MQHEIIWMDCNRLLGHAAHVFKISIVWDGYVLISSRKQVENRRELEIGFQKKVEHARKVLCYFIDCVNKF